MTQINRTFSIAPMMEWTDRHYRSLARIISKHTLLYTEMVTAPALVHGDVERHLKYNKPEHPIAVQLGGSDVDDLITATKHCDKYGYDEINLNVGCPSDRVQNGKIGAVLMQEPELVAQCLKQMADNTDCDVTVKHRIGLDDDNSYETLKSFVDIVANNSNCKTFIVHARNAILKGLSPKENREIPPLKYDYVYKLKTDFPELEIIINGGITDLNQTKQHLESVDGVMIGRTAYHTPYDLLVNVDNELFNQANKTMSRIDVVNEYITYMDMEHKNATPIHTMAKHLMGIFHSQKGGKAFRRHLSENMFEKDVTTDVVKQALSLVK
ncbi:MAG: tRNA dihydrouridine(20/20a) synthase DusA [Alphaproteobacteria bacterium]